MIPLLPTAYLPSISYIQGCLGSNKIILEQHEHYIKQTCRNRCHIYGANGKLSLAIPVRHKDLYRIPIHEVRILNDESWQKIHWRSIESAYRNSPFFEFFEDDIRPLYEKQVDTLFEWNLILLKKIFVLLKIEIEINCTLTYEDDPPDCMDLRTSWNNRSASVESSIRYHQVFEEKKDYVFIPDLSVIDLLFNEGNHSPGILTAG